MQIVLSTNERRALLEKTVSNATSQGWNGWSLPEKHFNNPFRLKGGDSWEKPLVDFYVLVSQGIAP